MEADDDECGEAWADILARRSPEGLAVVNELRRAENSALANQKRIMKAMEERRDYAKDFEAFEAAMGEVDRLRQKVYRLARQ